MDTVNNSLQMYVCAYSYIIYGNNPQLCMEHYNYYTHHTMLLRDIVQDTQIKLSLSKCTVIIVYYV